MKEINAKAVISTQKSAVPKSTLDKAKLAAHLRQVIAQSQFSHPDSELVVVTVDHGDATYDVLRWNGAEASKVFLVTHDILGPLQVGSTAIMRFYNADIDQPYLKGPGAGQFTVTDEPVPVLLGHWMQTYASPNWTACGVQDIEQQLGGTTFETLNTITGTTEELRGLQRTLGVVEAQGMVIQVAYRRNVTNTFYDAILVRAWNPDNFSNPLWTYVIDDFNELDTTSRPFTCNVFWDPTNSLLHILDAALWTVEINADLSAPITHQTLGADCSLLSGTAWNMALQFDGSLGLLRYTTVWGSVTTFAYASLGVDGYSTALLAPSMVSTDKQPNRIWPYDQQNLCFALVLSGLSTRDLETSTSFKETPSLTKINTRLHINNNGGLSKTNFSDTQTWTPLDLDSLIDAANAYYVSIYPQTITVVLDHETTEFQGTTPTLQGFFQFTGLPVTTNFARYYAGQMPITALSYLCPRSASQTRNSFQWGELNTDHIPGAVMDSAATVIYAEIEPFLIRYHGSLVNDAANPITETPNGGGGFDRIYYTWHKPAHTFGHRTMLRWVDFNGNVLTEFKLNNSFTGFDFGLLPDGSNAIATEALDVPENVWQLAVGVCDAPRAQKDAVVALHDFRGDKADEARPAISIFSPARTLAAQFTGLGPVSKVVGGPNDGRYVYQLLEPPKIRLNVPPADSLNPPIIVVGVWSYRIDGGVTDVYRTDVYIYEWSDINAPTLVSHTVDLQTALSARSFLTERDFDRLIFSNNRILYPSDSDSTWKWREIKY